MRKQRTRWMKKSSILAALFALMLLVVTGCQNTANGNGEVKNPPVNSETESISNPPVNPETESISNQGTEKAEETKAITLDVCDAEGSSTVYTINTDKEFLYDALLDVDGLTLDGYDSEYGFYITAVNGIQADYDTDGAYWSLYVNGEYGINGISTQPVADGDTYKLAYEKVTE